MSVSVVKIALCKPVKGVQGGSNRWDVMLTSEKNVLVSGSRGYPISIPERF